MGPGNLPIKKEDTSKDELIVNVDGDEDEDDEVCSAKKCLRPLGDDINWVQCDCCEKWYHLLCIGKILIMFDHVGMHYNPSWRPACFASSLRPILLVSKS